MTQEVNEKDDSQMSETTSEAKAEESTDTDVSSGETQDIAKVKEENKQLFERAKKAEIKVKELEALSSLKKEEPKSESISADNPLEIVKLTQALRDYSADEVDFINRQAKVLGVGLLEALEDEDTQLFIKAKREKVEKEKTNPKPTNVQGVSDKGFSEWTAEDIRELTSNPTKENIDKLNEYNQYMRQDRK